MSYSVSFERKLLNALLTIAANLALFALCYWLMLWSGAES